MKILVIEHATPEFPNGKKCLLGDMDVPLSQQGREEATNLRQSLQKSGIVFERIYTSDLKRALETAQILATDSQMIVKTASLRETNKGDLQKFTREEYKEKASYQHYKSLSVQERFFSPMGAGPDVESKAQLALRLIPLINEIRNDPSLAGKTIAIVTHGNPIKVIDTFSKNPGSLDSSSKLEEMMIPEYTDPNSCDIFLYEATSSSFEGKGQIFLNETSHIMKVL